MRFVDCSMIHDHDDHVLISAWLSVRYEECDNDDNEVSDNDDGDNDFNYPQ